MRNLLFIHLESLNNYIYRLHPEFFPTLREWEMKSVSFQKYFTTATSTLMAVSDILYGQLNQYEACKTITDVLDDYPCKASLLDEMKSKGYNAQALICHCGNDQIESEKRHMVGFDVEMMIQQEYEKHMQDIKREIQKEEPFAIIVCNHIANIGYQKLLLDGWTYSGLDRWEKGYRFMDDYVKEILDILVTSGKLGNTTIIFYGDHGDEFYSHGYHVGLTHAFEPYADIVHTPMWIFDSRWEGTQVVEDLIDASNLRQIATELISCPEKKMNWDNLQIVKKEYSLARCAYVAQPIREETFNKGYSITDGIFFMLVTSKGLELYDMRMDEGCHNNLLNFFIYEDGIISLDRELNDILGFHYRNLFNMNTIRQIRQRFYYFRKLLRKEVYRLYVDAGYEEKINEMKFEKIHYTR